jgi:hypothetical protein
MPPQATQCYVAFELVPSTQRLQPGRSETSVPYRKFPFLPLLPCSLCALAADGHARNGESADWHAFSSFVAVVSGPRSLQ